MSFNHIGFIGFGLIGGSIARAIKESQPDCTITVSSRTLAPLQAAKEDGIIDLIAETVNNAFSSCDLIIICTPVVTIAKYLEQLKPVISDTCIITDVGSVKGYIHDAVKAFNMECCFIGGHPMTGSQLTGYANSSGRIMNGAKYVLTPTSKTSKVQLDSLVDFVRALKSEPIVMDVKTHDRTVAGISHVPHLSACALVHMVESQDDNNSYMHSLAAGGFKDATRIAASSPEMWEQICVTNSDAISDMLSEYIGILTTMKKNIDERTPGYFKEMFNSSREYRNSFDE